jgi:type III secretory pathway component EscT
MPTSGLLPAPDQLEVFFAPLREPWGVRHGAMDAASLLLLALLRWVAIVQVSPFLGGRLVPGTVKIGLALVFAWFTVPWLSQQLPVPLAMGPLRFWLSALHEVAMGLLLGFGSSLVFFAAGMGGQFLDSARGTLMATVLVPQLQVQSSLLGDLYFQLFVVLYVLAGGHLFFLSAVVDSYRLFPPGGAMPAAALLNASFLKMTLAMFVLMVKIVAPALAVLLLADLVLGVANRVASQMDVFFLGLALKPAVGLLVVALSFYALSGVSREAFVGFHGWLLSWVRHG